MESSDDFIHNLRNVLQFLQDHGFTKAAEAVYESLESIDNKPSLDTEERQDSPTNSAPSGYGQEYADHAGVEDEYRSRSADPVLVSSRGASEEADEGEEEPLQGPWLPGDAAVLTTRLSGSTRLYEDPDVDEYDSMEDLGYVRRVVPNQQEFIMRHLDLLQDSECEPYFHHTAGPQYGGTDSVLSGSGSSSASLSSPGMSSCKHHPSQNSLSHDNSQQQDQQPGSGAPTGDAAWDSGPAGIVFAEPVTTPTKDSRRNSTDEPKCSLSRVESLSNSFIDELESCEGAGDRELSGRLSEVGSAAGDVSTPPRRGSAATAGVSTSAAASEYDDVIDLSPPSPPPDCAADAGFDLSNIFELGLRNSSRTSSVDVLYGSMRCWSETDSEMGNDSRPRSQGAASGSHSAPGVLTAGRRASKLQPQQQAQPLQQLGEDTPLQQQPQQQQQQDSSTELQPPKQPQLQLELEQQQGTAQQNVQQAVQPIVQQPQQQARCGEKQGEVSSGTAVLGFAAPAAVTTPPPAAAGSGGNSSGGGGGFGFSFPTTPPSAADAAVHEERAERVFSTWASNHSRSGLDNAEDEEDTGSSKPFIQISDALQEAADPNETSFDFAVTPAAVAPAPAAAAAVSKAAENSGIPTLKAVAADAAAADAAAAETVVLAAPVTPTSASISPRPTAAGSTAADEVDTLLDPFGTAAAAAAAAENGSSSRPGSSPASTPLHSRAAAAGTSSGSSRQQAGSESSTPTPGAAAAAAATTAAATGSARASRGSMLTEAGSEVPTSEALGYNGALGQLDSIVPPADAEIASTGGYSGSGELAAPRYVVDEAGNLLYEYDAAYCEQRYETFELRVIHRRRRTGFEDSKEFPIRKNDLIAGRYQVMDFLGSAAFSQAVQALDTATGALVCLKIIKNNKDYFDQSLDEIKLLRYVNAADPEDEHHIVRLYDFFYYKEHLFLVCELLRANLYEFQKYQRENGDEPYFTPPRIQRIATQVLQSLAFLHSLGLVHSDLKPENILIKSYSRCEVKVIDLGSSCFITDHLSSYVQSRSYRAPEVILGLAYGQKIDLWSLGCILAELATGYVLFQNDSLATLLVRLEGILGPLPSWMIGQGRYSSRYYTRSRQIFERNKANGRYELLLPKRTSLRHRVPGADEGFLDFLSYLLTPDPTARPSAEEALQHPWLSHPYPPVEQIPD